MDKDDDDMLLLLYRCHLSILHNNNFFFILDSMFMNIEPEDQIPRLLPANLNRAFDLLDNRWRYHHTRFNICQLRELYHHLDLPVSLTISIRGHKASSEEAFIITLTKLATGRTNTSLVEIYGATTETFISRVFKETIHLLNNKAEGILHGHCLQCWVHLFPDFAEAIRHKLNRPRYGELLFQDVRIFGFLDWKINETCTPGMGPLNDEELAERHPGA